MQAQCSGMRRLIEGHHASAGQFDLGDRSPSFFIHRRADYAFFPASVLISALISSQSR